MIVNGGDSAGGDSGCRGRRGDLQQPVGGGVGRVRRGDAGLPDAAGAARRGGAPGVKTYTSIAERAKAANALFLAVANKYGMTPDGGNARYFAGLTEIEAGENQQAEETLKKVAGGWDSDLAALAKLALAQLYHETGRDPQAIDLYNQLTAKPTATVPAGLAQLQLADLYQSEGKADDAKKIYANLKDKDPKGRGRQTAAEKLNPTSAPALPQR